MTDHEDFKSGYCEVNGIAMYYELHGKGNPLVLIHGGGSTIESTFGRLIPLLAKSRQIIAVEMQAHGHTNDRDAALTFEQDADDVAALLNSIAIAKADVLGFSNGGQTAIEIALRHPQLVNKIIIASAFYKRSAAPPQFWEGFEHATLSDMPEVLREAQLVANGNDSEALQNMFNRDVARMKAFKGWSDEQIRSIEAPVLVMNANHDVGSAEHAVEMYRMIPNSELVILPGGHGGYLGAIETLENGVWEQSYVAELIRQFLDKQQIKG